MTFIAKYSDVDYDVSFSDIVSAIVLALTGNFLLADLFASPSGFMVITLFFAGSLISFPWLGLTIINFSMAVVYTGYKKFKNSDRATLRKIQSKIKFIRL